MFENISFEEIEKYSVFGPRYTSYPTIPEWNINFNSNDIEDVFEKDNVNNDFSLYIHIPFCKTLCFYCACNTIITLNKKKIDNYVNYLIKEIKLLSKFINKKRKIRQIHFGGGSPSYLDEKQLFSIMNEINNNFSYDDDFEISIEVDPRNTNRDKVKFLSSLGFNRISMGVQDFDYDVQEIINRFQSFEETLEVVESSKEYNFESVNIDLVYGLPAQNIYKLEKTLELVNKINPDRIALFNYAHVPWLRPAQKSFKDEILPKPKDKFDFLKKSVNFLIDNNYKYIGMDHFAKENDSLYIAKENSLLSRNFMGYIEKHSVSLYGLGVTSISETENEYFQNLKTEEEYFSCIDKGILPINKGIKLNFDDKLRKEIINSLTCNLKINKSYFEKNYNIQFDDYFNTELKSLIDLESDNLIKSDNNNIFVTDKGQLLMRNIAMVFDKYLRNSQNKKIFSATV